MFGWLQRYQKPFYLLVAIVIIASFALFGTYEVLGGGVPRKEERVVGRGIDGAPILSSEVEKLAFFLASDRDDRGPLSNLCNDGVIRSELLKTGIASLLAHRFWEVIQGDLQERWSRVRSFSPSVNVRHIWKQWAPAILEELEAVQKEEGSSLQFFSHLVALYQAQEAFPPERLRQCLCMEGGHLDARWDGALFGFHSLLDWFGPRFLEVAAQFFIQGARYAAEAGFSVPLDEARGDLLYQFEQGMAAKPAAKRSKVRFKEYLRSLGLDEWEAAETWHTVLLFRRYFDGLATATLLDRLPYDEFASFAQEEAHLAYYEWPAALRWNRAEELAQLSVYLRAISPEEEGPFWPQTFYPLEETKKRAPYLVRNLYRAKVGIIDRKEIALRGTIEEVWGWQLDHWEELRSRFPILRKGHSREECFAQLQGLSADQRGEIERWTRLELLPLHPEWIEEALSKLPLKDRHFYTSEGKLVLGDLILSQEWVDRLDRAVAGETQAMTALTSCVLPGGGFVRMEEVQIDEKDHRLLFSEAKGLKALRLEARALLEKAYSSLRDKHLERFQTASGQWRPWDEVSDEVALLHFEPLLGKPRDPSSRFLVATREAYRTLQQNPLDPSFVRQEGENPWNAQGKLVCTATTLSRSQQEGAQGGEPFSLTPGSFSSIRERERGAPFFFYVKARELRKGKGETQILIGKEGLEADTKRYLAKKVLQRMDL